MLGSDVARSEASDWKLVREGTEVGDDQSGAPR
jgi:hypothetical protein